MSIKKAEVLLANCEYAVARQFLQSLLLKDKFDKNAMYLLSIAEAQLGNTGEALNVLSRIIALEPNHAAAHYTKANILLSLNKHLEALPHHDRAVELLKENPWSFVNRGISRSALGHYAEAIDDFDKAIELNPKLSAAYGNKGTTLVEMMLYESALYFLNEAIELELNNFGAVSSKSACLFKLKQPEEALIFADRAINLNPNSAKAWTNRGNALNDLKRYAEALSSYERAIELKSEYAESWSNRGNALSNLKRYEEALASYERSIELKPSYAESWSNRGNTLSNLKRYEEALASYERSIELEPDNGEAIFNKALLKLSQKEFRSGFEGYVWRWKTQNFSSPHIQTTLPTCGPNCSPKNILLWAEQGLGDEIFYAGMLTQALDRFPNISLIADARLHPIFARSFPEIKLLDSSYAKLENFDTGFESQAPIGDLGRILTLDGEKIKASRKPFLISDPDKKSSFQLRERFGQRKSVCGLSWSSTNKDFGNEKSIDLLQLDPILKNPKFEFVNLQYGEVHSEIQKVKDRFGTNIHEVKDLDLYTNIDGLLSLIEACDLVITTSNVTAHLAGSIGKKGCVLVPFSKGKIWYWHLNDVFSLWYPNLRVFYQTDRYDWSKTISQAHKWLDQDFL